MVSKKKKSAIRRQFSSLQNALSKNDKSKNSKYANYFNHSNSILWIVSGLILSACAPGRQQRLPDDITPDPADIPPDDLPALVQSGNLVNLFEGTFLRDTPTGYHFAANAPDGSNVSFDLSDDARFAIDDTGNLVIQAGSEFDYENSSERTVTLTVTAIDADDTSVIDTQNVTVSFLNINDNVPTLSVSGTALLLDEGLYQLVTDTGIIVTANDADGPTPDVTLSDSRFEIGANGSLQIVAGSEFDFATEANLSLLIAATDAEDAASSISQTITISVTDLNDEPPVFTSAATASVDENTAYAAADVILTAAATPDVAGDAVTYSLSGADATLFAIDAATGEVTFAADTTPDHEAKASY